jgi:hypothetical protein
MSILSPGSTAATVTVAGGAAGEAPVLASIWAPGAKMHPGGLSDHRSGKQKWSTRFWGVCESRSSWKIVGFALPCPLESIFTMRSFRGGAPPARPPHPPAPRAPPLQDRWRAGRCPSRRPRLPAHQNGTRRDQRDQHQKLPQKGGGAPGTPPKTGPGPGGFLPKALSFCRCPL